MIKNIIVILLASFIFDFIFGSFLMKRPELFSKIQNSVPKTNARHVYKLIFIMMIAVIAVILRKNFNIDDIMIAIILGFAISISGVLFSIPKSEIKK